MTEPAVANSLSAHPARPGLEVRKGNCLALFAYDVGMSIDLLRAERALTAAQRPEIIRHKRRSPEYFGYQAVPVRAGQAAEPVQLGKFRTSGHVELVLFDFGAIGVQYTIPIEGPLEDLLELSDKLYENPALMADSRRRAEQLVAELRDSIDRPAMSGFVEDYWVLQIEELGESEGAATIATEQELIPRLLGDARHLVARILRAELGQLSEDEVDEALSCRISFAPDDIALIDWSGAIVVGREMGDVLAVLEYVNVELLEMRYLDHRLDGAMEMTTSPRVMRGWWPAWPWRSSGAHAMRAVAELQVDGVRLFEEVNNSLKLLGDQYLARVYKLASKRLHLPEWDAAILRKLDTIESIYQKMNDFQTSRRLEALEWIVIILIATEIVLSFVR